MVEDFDKVPFKALQYLTGECNYGGRVTDGMDRRVLQSILKDFYTTQVLDQNVYEFAGKKHKDYHVFKGEILKEYLEYVKHLPDEESPYLMGLHENANIT